MSGRRLRIVALAVALAMGACEARGCGCGGDAAAPEEAGGSARDEAREPAGEGLRGPTLELTEAAFTGAGLVLPRPDELDAWVYLEEPVYYSPDDLPELLGEAAPSYVALGLHQTAYALLGWRVAPARPGGEARLEVYAFRMRSPEAARQKWDDDHAAPTCRQHERLSAQHCLTNASLDLLAGPYYVRLVLEAPAPELVEPMVAVAERVLERLSSSLRSARPLPR